MSVPNVYGKKFAQACQRKIPHYFQMLFFSHQSRFSHTALYICTRFSPPKTQNKRHPFFCPHIPLPSLFSCTISFFCFEKKTVSKKKSPPPQKRTMARVCHWCVPMIHDELPGEGRRSGISDAIFDQMPR